MPSNEPAAASPEDHFPDALRGGAAPSPGRRTPRRCSRWLLFLIALLSLGAMALSGTALWLQQEVERQRAAVAEERRRGDDLVSFMLSDLHADLAPLGRLDLLEKPARKALSYYQDDPGGPLSSTALSGRSVALDHIGEILTRRGDLPRAREAYREALALAEEAARRHPADDDRQRELAVSHARIADASEAQGDLAAARQAYGEALAIFSRISDAAPEDAQRRYDRAVMHERLGRVLSAEANFPAALEEFRARQLILLQLTATAPEALAWQRDLGHNYGALGDLFLTQGDRPAANAAYQRFQEIAQALAQKDPAHADWQRDLAVSFEKTGDLRAVQGDVTGARLAYQHFAEVAARLAAQDPGNLQWQRDLAASQERTAALLAAQNKFGEAALRQQRAAEQLAVVAERQGTAPARAEAAGAFGRLAWYQLLQRHAKEAVDAAQRGLALDGSQARLRLTLAHGLLYSGRGAEAERVYRQNRNATLQGEKRFDEEALSELRDFIVRGIVPPDMAPVESWLKAGG
ncbi:MAG: hypothetical protein FJ189_05230 [Gammaproteobacteria bacterium]|nr:hypothetical protein [Gammaproteobacteria bacterium]